ncbi:MAG: hypothetical protein P4L74_02735 [Candidatus Doudnabacteria bacterium]|nr:hypothetical protein [Candidatus Doudnabacteria bacterium]
MDSRDARRLLKEKGLADVEVVDYVLGYEDGKDLYFVSSWDPRLETTLEGYLPVLEKQAEAGDAEAVSELKDLTKKITDIQVALGPVYWDTKARNIFYDSKTKKLFVTFDLNKTREHNQ